MVAASACIALAGCTYLRYASIQREYARLQEADPSQRNLKHMLDRPNFAVVGRTEGSPGEGRAGPAAVLAFSSRFRTHELVDAMHGITFGTHFGLDLPAGEYSLLVVVDRDNDGHYRADEVVGRSELSLSEQALPTRVLTGHRIEVGEASAAEWPLDVPVEHSVPREESLFYPAGTIRRLDDAIFSPEMSTLGLYDPASFFAQAPTLFYALDEEVGYKIPIVMVHGAGGSAREFAPLVERLDRSRFKPWFFHYPSGGDLDQLGELFHRIFLSGDAVNLHPMVPLVVVAHSMGGLVVRRALAELEEPPATDIIWISLATPFGGHPSARGVNESSMLILPSWRDLDPESAFLAALYRRPLPAQVTHHLLYAYRDESLVRFGENSDGVVPLSSQLQPSAQRQATRQLGIDATHVGILHATAALDAVGEILAGVQTRIPREHMAVLRRGGFVVDEGDYTPLERFAIERYGHFLRALADGELAPLDEQQAQLVAGIRGQAESTDPSVTAWRKFTRRR